MAESAVYIILVCSQRPDGWDEFLQGSASARIGLYLRLYKACRYVPVFRILPHFSTLGIQLKVISAIKLRGYIELGSPSHNPEVAGSNPAPAILITQVKPVTYGWLFSCAKPKILGLGVPGACLGVPVTG